MPWKLQPKCKVKGCQSKANARGGYCHDHVFIWHDREKKRLAEAKKERLKDPFERELHDFYLSPEWRRLRAWQLAHEPLCRVCKRTARMVDHILQIRHHFHMRLDKENLQSMCNECHNQKRTHESQQARLSKLKNQTGTEY